MPWSPARTTETLVERALGPVWEANHVWLILSIVLLFSGFPEAFGALCVALAIPLLLVLLGIVLRGCSFVFRSYFTGERRTQLYWGKVFSISSSMTPLFLGILIGAISGDRVIMNRGISENGFLNTWIFPFPIAVGILALSLFAYLSACYLAVEAGNTALEDDFRFRALISGAVSIAMALATYALAGASATAIRQGLSNRPAAWIAADAFLPSLSTLVVASSKSRVSPGGDFFGGALALHKAVTATPRISSESNSSCARVIHRLSAAFPVVKFVRRMVACEEDAGLPFETNHLGRIEKAPEVPGPNSELGEGRVDFPSMAQVCRQRSPFRGIRPEAKFGGGPSDQFISRIAKPPLECFVHFNKSSILKGCHR
ncbi:MAG: cytochrome d ubiquinol oxidase subunit II [Acidobacteriaceae bacterium]